MCMYACFEEFTRLADVISELWLLCSGVAVNRTFDVVAALRLWDSLAPLHV